MSCIVMYGGVCRFGSDSQRPSREASAPEVDGQSSSSNQRFVELGLNFRGTMPARDGLLEVGAESDTPPYITIQDITQQS